MSELYPGGRPPQGFWEQAKEWLDKLGLWTLMPVISAAVFVFIFCRIADQLNLGAFQWYTVELQTNNVATPTGVVVQILPARTNLLSALTNFVPTIASRTSSTKAGKTNDTADTGKSSKGEPKPKPHPLARELVTRLLWGVSALALFLLSMGIVIQSARMAHQESGWVAALFLIAVALLVFCVQEYRSRGTIPAIAGGNAAEQLMQALESTTSPARHPQFPATVPEMRPAVAWLSAAAATALASVAMACSFLLYGIRQKVKLGYTADFKRAAEAGRDLMGLTAIGLVAGVIEVYVLYSLAAQHVHADLSNDALHFGTGLATVAGLIYSGMLVAIFAPVVAALRDYGRDLLRALGPPIQTDDANAAEEKRADDKMADEKKTDPGRAALIREEKFKDGQRKEAKAGGGIDSPAKQVIKSVVTALAPVLAAFLAKLVDVLMGLATG